MDIELLEKLCYYLRVVVFADEITYLNVNGSSVISYTVNGEEFYQDLRLLIPEMEEFNNREI